MEADAKLLSRGQEWQVLGRQLWLVFTPWATLGAAIVASASAKSRTWLSSCVNGHLLVDIANRPVQLTSSQSSLQSPSQAFPIAGFDLDCIFGLKPLSYSASFSIDIQLR